MANCLLWRIKVHFFLNTSTVPVYHAALVMCVLAFKCDMGGFLKKKKHMALKGDGGILWFEFGCICADKIFYLFNVFWQNLAFLFLRFMKGLYLVGNPLYLLP